MFDGLWLVTFLLGRRLSRECRLFVSLILMIVGLRRTGLVYWLRLLCMVGTRLRMVTMVFILLTLLCVLLLMSCRLLIRLMLSSLRCLGRMYIGRSLMSSVRLLTLLVFTLMLGILSGFRMSLVLRSVVRCVRGSRGMLPRLMVLLGRR